MITKIALDKVACYKSLTTLETDKKINLIYGLNGVGKSTFSNYLLRQKDERYKNCYIEGLDDNHEILVYNQSFIQESFFEPDNLKGIFTLSKENKEAELKIENAKKEIEKFEESKEKELQKLRQEEASLSEKKELAKNRIWKIKTDYTGGDRVFEICLEGYKGSKNTLFDHILNLKKPISKPDKTLESIKNDLQVALNVNVHKYSELSKIKFNSHSIEMAELFKKHIVGNENSTISQLIKDLGNSDWIKKGLEYLPESLGQGNETCPFCQEKTISSSLMENIKNYFDASYEADIQSLNLALDQYSESIHLIPKKNNFELNPKFEVFRDEFEIKYSNLFTVLENNKRFIEEKIKTPSVSVNLET
ncbi:AAA family ATPase, partial [Saccharibacillus sacchari]